MIHPQLSSPVTWVIWCLLPPALPCSHTNQIYSLWSICSNNRNLLLIFRLCASFAEFLLSNILLFPKYTVTILYHLEFCGTFFSPLGLAFFFLFLDSGWQFALLSIKMELLFHIPFSFIGFKEKEVMLSLWHYFKHRNFYNI